MSFVEQFLLFLLKTEKQLKSTRNIFQNFKTNHKNVLEAFVPQTIGKGSKSALFCRDFVHLSRPRTDQGVVMVEPEVEHRENLTADETEEEHLRAENERLRAENAALKHREGRGANIPPRPHTTDPSGHREHDPSSEPPAGGSLDAIMKWREQRGRSARSGTEDSSDFGPPVLRARSWLAKTPLSNKPNPVSPSSAVPPARAAMTATVACAPPRAQVWSTASCQPQPAFFLTRTAVVPGWRAVGHADWK